MIRNSILNFFVTLLAVMVISCSNGNKEYHDVIDQINSRSVSIEKDSSVLNDKFNAENLVTIRDGKASFFVQSRKNVMKNFECTECHTDPVEVLKGEGLGKKAHWDITLAHAESNTMNCATCHSDSNMDQLSSITAMNIDFDQSYQLCRQCHTKQAKDWLGGAHGKNLSGWKGPRVSKLCVECHNPHNPSIPSRWPSRYNSQMANQRTP